MPLYDVHKDHIAEILLSWVAGRALSTYLENHSLNPA